VFYLNLDYQFVRLENALFVKEWTTTRVAFRHPDKHSIRTTDGGRRVTSLGKKVMRSSKATGHGGASNVTVFSKKLRAQRLWKAEKTGLSFVFEFYNLLKILKKVREKICLKNSGV
jgi:hypothetical protein